MRTYPVPAASGIESSCTAGITNQGEWLRIFPVPWRLLTKDEQFRKYQWVDVDVAKAPDDSRRESYHLQPSGIRIHSSVGTERNWQARKDVVFPLKSHCLCCLTKQRDAQQYPTLGLFRPKSIGRLRITPDDTDWTPAQLAMLRQENMFVQTPKRELEKIPQVFRYQFFCEHDDCPSHTLMCTDWEMGQSYRRWRADYGDGWQEKFRQRYEAEMINRYDTHFFVGTVASHPNRWIIIGLFYPPRVPEEPQGGLF